MVEITINASIAFGVAFEMGAVAANCVGSSCGRTIPLGVLVAFLKGDSYGAPWVRSGAWVEVRTPCSCVVRCRVTPGLVEPVRIEVTFGIVAACVGEVERPIFRLVVITRAIWTAYEVLGVVSVERSVRKERRMVLLGSAAGPGSGSGLLGQSWSGAGSRRASLRPWSGSRSRSGLWLRAWSKSNARSSGWSASRTRVGLRTKSWSLSRSTIA